ncbi:trefoil factor 3-like [Trichosurus vulpecula]|uniref:trefoil factor 3-like n=1 Tax=Trichosurus vulpecula TaxID=9337 RepID=UPI00186B39B6|nr:trefoil factor 3-like [Trichosurus vulpecula]
MDLKGLCFVAFALMLGFSSTVGEYIGLSDTQCAVPSSERVDCGYPKVTEEQCNSRGCCFDSSIPEVPWCFKPLQEADPSSDRVLLCSMLCVEKKRFRDF